MSEDKTAAIKSVIDTYLACVKNNDGEGFRRIFDPEATITHLAVKSGEARTSGLEAFIASIAALHGKFENAEELAREIEVLAADQIATARVRFDFIMGSRTLSGQDLFNLVDSKGTWKIVHKTYYL